MESIESLIAFFSKSLTEYKNFNHFLKALKENLNLVEIEVDELRYIINLCEQNLSVDHVQVEEKQAEERLNRENTLCRTFFVLQYTLIKSFYDKFSLDMIMQMKLDERYSMPINDIKNPDMLVRLFHDVCESSKAKYKSKAKTKILKRNSFLHSQSIHNEFAPLHDIPQPTMEDVYNTEYTKRENEIKERTRFFYDSNMKVGFPYIKNIANSIVFGSSQSKPARHMKSK